MFGAVAAVRRAAFHAPHSIYRGLAAPSLTMASARKQSTLPAGYKEDHSKGAMLRFEDSLPRLPVPTLEETAKRYLKSVHPLLNADEFKHTTKVVEEFIAPQGAGRVLQKRLEERAADPNTKNWLSEWWDNDAYLAYRDPVCPFVSYFYSHKDDRKRRSPAKRAAAITYAVLDFKKQVDEGSLEPDYMKARPIAMSSFDWLFNCSRRPAKPADYSVKLDYKKHPYILVIRKNQLFKLPHEVNGKPLTCAELEASFRRVYQIAESSPDLGMLTASNRDFWTDARERLIRASPVNEASLEAVEGASFVVCLDSESPVTREERARQYWHGAGNRWFDKPLQFIINDNGTSGFCGEHSQMDGTPTHRLNDYINALIFNNKLDFDNPSVRSDLPEPSPIRFELKEENKADIATATAAHLKVIAEHELRVEAYQGYGKEFMKKVKCSPDGYVQMLIQLAYFKFYGKSRPTYESAATRRFQLGRTETCRSVSDESVAWVTAMAARPQSTDEECRNLFRKAIASQGQYIVDASDGRGVDRHMYGLKKLIADGEPVPAVFKDAAYTYSSKWFISSSQLSSEYFNGYGWSQVINEGWGIAYMINSESINFNIVSKSLGCDRMAFYLNEAAEEMRDLLLPTIETKAKL